MRNILPIHSLGKYCLALCWLASIPVAAQGREVAGVIQPVSATPAETTLISGPVKLDMRVSTLTEKEYLPNIGADIYTWTEERLQMQMQVFIRPRVYVTVGWLDANIEQKNELYGDLDFRLQNQAPSLGFGLPVGSMVKIRGQVATEEYNNDSSNAFYQLEKKQTLVTGYFETSMTAGNVWAAASYKRERDTDPILDVLTDRARLNISAQELSGLAISWKANPRFEFGSSIYYEQYETQLADQFNINAEMAYNPAWSKSLSLSLGSGYYTEEEETLVNMTVGYFTVIGALDLSLEWQLEFSDNENSLLNQGRAFMKYYVVKNVSCYMQGEYGQESGDDKDTFYTATAGLELAF